MPRQLVLSHFAQRLSLTPAAADPRSAESEREREREAARGAAACWQKC